MKIAFAAGRSNLDEQARTAAGNGADLLLAPRALEDWHAARDEAEPSDGPFADTMIETSTRHGIAILAGMIEHCSSGTFNAAMLCEANGHMLCCYRQTHMPETAIGSLLDHGQWLTQARLGDIMVGILIGEDLLHPEAARALAISGTEVILVLEDGRIDADHLRVLTRARAIENHLPVVLAAPGLSAAASPSGAFEPCEIFDVSCARAAAEEGRKTRLSRRRPRLYNAITMIDEGEDLPPL